MNDLSEAIYELDEKRNIQIKYVNEFIFKVEEYTEVEKFFSQPEIHRRFNFESYLMEFYYREESASGRIHLHFFEFNLEAALTYSNNLNLKISFDSLQKSFRYLFTLDERELHKVDLQAHKVIFKKKHIGGMPKA